jgi:hypothetical protein
VIAVGALTDSLESAMTANEFEIVTDETKDLPVTPNLATPGQDSPLQDRVWPDRFTVPSEILQSCIEMSHCQQLTFRVSLNGSICL